ncbi:MAG TPA: hypothetical protein VIK91_28610 [Nannocystis sp.]
MTGLLAAVVAALSLGPADATRLACRLENYAPCGEVLKIVAVESRGVAVGLHTGHARRVRGAVFYRAAVRAGWLRPDECDRHDPRGDGAAWGIRGAHGLAAAYSVRHLGECVGFEAIDVPLLSAVATIRRLRVLRDRYGLRTIEARAEAWRRGVTSAR